MEYDENRIIIAHDIGCRFLDIESPSTAALNNGNAVDGEGNNGEEEQHQKLDDEKILTSDPENITTTSTTNLVETELCNNTTANITTPPTTAATTTTTSSSSNHKNFHHHNGEEHNNDEVGTFNDGGGGGGGCGDGGGGIDEVDRIKNCIDSTTTTVLPQLNGNSTNANKSPLASDEFVLDVLNDDLISRVRSKITSGSKELFEPCVKAVKAFLAGEPFREFETSMYFHR